MGTELVIGAIVVLCAAAIAMQFWYLRANRAQITGAARAVVFVNVALLALVLVGLVAWAVIRRVS